MSAAQSSRSPYQMWQTSNTKQANTFGRENGNLFPGCQQKCTTKPVDAKNHGVIFTMSPNKPQVLKECGGELSEQYAVLLHKLLPWKGSAQQRFSVQTKADLTKSHVDPAINKEEEVEALTL